MKPVRLLLKKTVTPRLLKKTVTPRPLWSITDLDIPTNRYHRDFTLMLMRLHHSIAGLGDAKEEGSH
jgi:hypothetical protein